MEVLRQMLPRDRRPGERPAGQRSRMTSVMPTTLSAMAYLLTRGCAAVPMLMTWKRSSGEARI